MAKTLMRGDAQREVEDVITDLKSTLLAKRLKAVKELARLRSPLGVEPLREILADRSKEVRCAVVEALVAIKPATLLEMLLPLLRDRSADVRLRVAHGLGELEGEGIADHLFELMRDAKEDVASMAVRSLARFKPPQLTRLIRLFGDKTWKLRRRASEALRGIGGVAVEALKLALLDQDEIGRAHV